MYLSQVKSTVDTSKKFTIDGQEVYKTFPFKNERGILVYHIVVVAGYEKYGRDTNIYYLSPYLNKKLKEITTI